MRRGLNENEASALGAMIDLCARNRVYLEWSLKDIDRLFIPPIVHRQYRLFTLGNEVVGFATWAYLSKAWHRRLSIAHEDPDSEAWKSGTTLWIIDYVMPRGGQMLFSRILQRDIFLPGETKGYALRRTSGGQVRRISRLYARNR